MTRSIHHLWHDTRGAGAAEFALVLPVLVLFLFGIIDAGRMMWTWNNAEKATQMGVRMAAVTAPVPSGMAAHNFAGTNGLTSGDPIPAGTYDTMTCGTATSNGTAACQCSGSCPWGTAAADASFTAIYDRMKLFLPELGKQHVKIEYAPSGLGYAGDPSGPDIFPLITVRLQGLTYTPMVARLFGTSMTLPSFKASLTLEDGQGTQSN